MTSLVNTYLHQSKANEQNLINGFVKESIQMLGETYYYLPRDIQIKDLVFGEDILSKFPLSIPVEMYLTDVLGFQGDREMFSKFGLEVKNSYKLVVSKDRWDEEVGAQFDNGSFRFKLEDDNQLILDGSTNARVKLLGEFDDLIEADFDIANYIRPREGDLIYDPRTKYLFEIKFVDHDVEFFALGKNYQYYLSCEAFQYQNEVIETGDAEIDNFDFNTLDTLANQVLLEDGFALLLEDDGYLTLEDGSVSEPIRTPELVENLDPELEEIKFTINDPFSI